MLAYSRFCNKVATVASVCKYTKLAQALNILSWNMQLCTPNSLLYVIICKADKIQLSVNMHLITWNESNLN